MRAATIGRVVAAAAAALAICQPVVAQGFLCEYAPAIVSLSDSILAKRMELSRFQRRNAPAAEAAFLKIHYAPLADGDAEALLSNLIEDGARGVDDVAFAWSFGMYEGRVTTSMLGPDAVDTFVARGSHSALRAMVRDGHEDDLLAAITKLDASAVPSVALNLAVAILDYSDDWKTRVADRALELGLPVVAAAIVATHSKGGKAWALFLDKLGDPALASELTALWRWVPSMMGLPELPRTPDQDPPSDPELRERLHEIMATSMETPQLDFVMTLLNQTGSIDEIHPASTALRGAIERGEIARDGLFGPAWLLLYRALLDSWTDDEQLRSQLASFEIATPRGGRNPLEILDALIATETLAPYLRGELTEPPEAPSELSPAFAAVWPQWARIATQVKANPSDPSLLEEATFPIAVELLVAAGNTDAAASLVASAPASFGVTNIAIDMAVHLDRLCGRYFYHPAESLQFAGRPVFKFDG